MGRTSAASRLAALCLLALAVVMPLTPQSELLPSGKHVVFLLFAGLGMLCVWLDGLRGGQAPALGTPVDVAVGAFFAAAVPSALLAVNAGLARYETGLLLASALTYVLALKTLRSPGDVRRLCVAVLLASLVIATAVLLGYRRFRADAAPEAARAAYLSPALFGRQIFAHSYLAAQYLVMGFAGGLVLLFEGGARGAWRWLLAAALLPIGACLLVTGSRGAYLAVAVALLAHLLLRARAATAGAGRRGQVVELLGRAAFYAAVAALLLAAATVAGVLPDAAGHALDRMLLVFDPQASDLNFSRLRVWKDTLRMAADHVVWGVGPGGFDTLLPSYHYSAQPVPHAHNQFLHVLAERGLLGLVALLFVLRHALVAARKGAAALARDDERRPLFHAGTAALTAALVYFLFETPLVWAEAGSLIMTLLALVTRAGCVSRDRPQRPAFAAAGLLTVAALAGFVLPTWVRYAQSGSAALASFRHQAAARSAQARGDGSSLDREIDLALQDLQRADDDFPFRADFPAACAEILFAAGRNEEALAAARVADARVPNAFRSLDLIGVCLMRLGRHERAIEPLRRAVSAHRGPEAAEAYLLLGRACYAAGRYEEAWLVFTGLRDSGYDVEHPELLIDCARTLLQLDRNLAQVGELLDAYERVQPEVNADFVAALRADVALRLARPRRTLQR